MSQSITTAVFPVAGLGTRFLPATKSCPKEMLTLVDRPLIQYVVDEALAAGVTQLIFVTSYTKRAIEDYFDSNYELEHRLEQRNNQRALSLVKEIVPKNVSCIFVRQPYPAGLGDAILCAKDVIANKPFMVLLADDVLDEPKHGATLKAMMDIYDRTQGSVLAVEHVDRNKTDQYGIVATHAESEYNQVDSIVEKPKPSDAPSQLGVIGRYILSPAIMAELERTEPGVGGELQLTDAIARLLKKEHVCAYPMHAQRFDCGNRVGFFQAYLHFAAKFPELLSVLQDSYTVEEV